MSSTNTLLGSTYRVYIKYSPNSLPPHPGRGWTRFVCASDTHRRQIPMVDGDIMIHSGDFTSFTSGFRSALDWIKGLRYHRKLLIAGNHEFNLDESSIDNMYARSPEIRAELEEDRRILRDQSAVEANLTYLEAESAIVSGPSSEKTWPVYGSPYTPEYGTMGFSYRENQADNIWAPIPHETEILITHGPPFEILDLARRGRQHVGCRSLSRTVLHRLPKVRLHVFGHIHEGRGAEVHKGFGGQDIVFVNAACQDQRSPMPIVVDLKDDADNQTNGDAHMVTDAEKPVPGSRE